MSSAETRHFETKVNIDDISAIDNKPYVETIAEEIEPESNISTIIHDSLTSSPSKVKGSSSDLQNSYINEYKNIQSNGEMIREELNSTMKNFNSVSIN